MTWVALSSRQPKVANAGHLPLTSAKVKEACLSKFIVSGNNRHLFFGVMFAVAEKKKVV